MAGWCRLLVTLFLTGLLGLIIFVIWPHPNQHIIKSIRSNSLLEVDNLLQRTLSEASHDPQGMWLTNINMIDLGSHRTPLHVAARYGRCDIVSLLLNKYRADVNAQDSLGKTPLHEAAAYSDDVSCIQRLVDKGAQLEVEMKSGWTPLFNAVYFSNTAAVALLLRHGANVNHRVFGFDATAKSLGISALTLALRHSRAEIAKMLVDSGATLGEKEQDYKSYQLIKDLPWRKIDRSKGVEWERTDTLLSSAFATDTPPHVNQHSTSTMLTTEGGDTRRIQQNEL